MGRIMGSVPSSSLGFTICLVSGCRYPVEGEIVDGFHGRRTPSLPSQLGKEGCQADEIFPFPLLRRMIMAARALNPHAEKSLRG